MTINIMKEFYNVDLIQQVIFLIIVENIFSL